MSNLLNTLIQKVTDLTNAFNAQTENSRLTNELPIASTPIGSSDLIRIEQGGKSRQVRFEDFDPGNTPVPPYDDTWIQPALDTKMVWKGNWVNATYSKNDVVLDGVYLMVANKVTSDQAGPTGVGQSSDLFTGTLTGTSNLAKTVMIGQAYKLGYNYFLNRYRLYVREGFTYDMFIVTGRDTPQQQINQLISFTAGSTGWISNSAGNLLVRDDLDMLCIVTEPDPVPDVDSFVYDYDTPGGAGQVPQSGEIKHNNNATGLLLVHKTDNGGNDRSAVLEALGAGDKISDGQITWSIQGATDNGTHMTYDILPTIQSQDGIKTFDFQTAASTDVEYDVETGYWSGNAEVRGLIAIDGYVGGLPNLTENDNQYIIDIEIQEVTISDDWDFMSSTGLLGGASSVPNDIEIIDNLVTQDATKALSANQGYILDQKILALPPPADLSAYMLKATYDPNGNGFVDLAEDANELGGQLPAFYDQSAHVANSGIHVTATEKAAIVNANAATSLNPFATMADVAAGDYDDSWIQPALDLKLDIVDALELGTTATTAAPGNHLHDSRYEPINSNIQAHIANADIHLAVNEQDAIRGAAAASGANVFATMADLSTLGYGDMLKSEYDVTDNGIVDDAERLGGQTPSYYATQSALLAHLADTSNPHDTSWNNLLNVPTEFPPAPHNHDGVYEPANANIQAHIADTSVHLSITERGAIDNANNPNAGNAFATMADLSVLGYGDMLKSEYDVTDNGVVDNSERLGGELPSYFATANALLAHVNDASVHLSLTERGAIDNANNPNASNAFVTESDIAALTFGDMYKSQYDITDNGVVDDAERLGGETPSYYGQLNKVGQVWTGTNVFDGLLTAEVAILFGDKGGYYHSIDGQSQRIDFNIADGLGSPQTVKSLPLGDADQPGDIMTLKDVNNAIEGGTIFANIIPVPVFYGTGGNNEDSNSTLKMETSATLLLDSTDLTIGWQQQAANVGIEDFTIGIAPGDTVIGYDVPINIPSGYFAYYLLIEPNTWSVAIGQIGSDQEFTLTIEGNYEQVKGLKDSGNLIPGFRYIINDYQTKYTIYNSDSGGIVDSDTVNAFVSGYMVLLGGYQYDLVIGREVEINYLPPGYAGSLVLGEVTTVTANFSDYYFKFANNMHTDEANNLGIGISWALPRFDNLPVNELVLDSYGNVVMQQGGVINTDVHNGLPYMDQTGEENIPPPIERIILIAADESSFEPEGQSGTFAGDVILYDIDDTETEDANGFTNGTRKGLVKYRRNFPTDVEMPLDWRATRFRRYLPDLESRTKLSNNHDDNLLVIPAEEMENGKKYEIVELGDTDWYAAGASRVIGHAEIDDIEQQEGLEVTIVTTGSTDFTIYGAPDSRPGTTFVKNALKGSGANAGTVEMYKDIRGVTEILTAGNAGVNCEVIQTNDTDFTLLGSNEVVGATAIATSDVCKIVTVGDTDFTLIGSPDNNVGTIFTATGVGVGTGTADIGSTRGKIFVSNGVASLGEGRVDVMLNVGKSFYFNGTPVVGTTGTVRLRTMMRQQGGWNMCGTDVQGRDPVTNVDAYYVACEIESEFNSTNCEGVPKLFKIGMDDYAQAKDYTVIPIDSNYNFIKTKDADSCIFDKSSNIVNSVWIDEVPTVQGHQMLIDVRGAYIFKCTFTGLMTMPRGSSGVEMLDCTFLDEFRCYSNVRSIFFRRATMLGIFYLNFCWGFTAVDVIFGVNDPTSEGPGSNYGYAWSSWNHINGVRMFSASIGTRATKTVLADSGFHSGIYVFPNNSTITTEDSQFTSRDAFRVIGCTFSKTSFRCLSTSSFSTMVDTNTGKRGNLRWDRITELLLGSAFNDLKLKWNFASNSLLEEVIDENNVRTLEEYRVARKCQDSWS